MSDEELIRRGDALGAAWEADSLELSTHGTGKIEARINAIPAVQPTVKPLVWGEDRDADSEDFGAFVARSPTVHLRYIVRKVYGGGWKLTGSVPFGQPTIDTLKAAKAAAQADYEARILSALDMQPTVSPDVAALVEAAEKVISSYWYASDGVITGIYDLETALARVKGETK